MADREVETRPASMTTPVATSDAGTSAPSMMGSVVTGVGAPMLQRKVARRLVQRRSSNGVMPGAEGHVAAAAGSQGSALPAGLQQRFESSLGADLSAVRVHTGTASEAAADSVGAKAFTMGNDIHFASGHFDAGSTSGQELLAHEVAHTVQQSRSGASTSAQYKLDVSMPEDASEMEADRAASAMVAGVPAPRLGAAHSAGLHRAVNTNGGIFNDPYYQPVSSTGAVGTRVGAGIMIDFTPGDLVEAPANGVALVQSVKGDTNRVGSTNTLHAANDQGNTAVSGNADDTQLVTPSGAGAGSAIDIPIHRPGRNDANHNPIYGVGFGAAAPSTSLHDGTPTLGRGQRGAHVKNPDGSFQSPVNAQMEDGPGRVIGTAGQTFDMAFEVAAMVTDGPMSGTYLGSVSWGWQSDAAGQSTLKPFAAVASGSPTAGFMGAAQTWNNSTFHNNDGTTVNSVDLPITSLPSSVQAAVDQPTPALVTRFSAVQTELAGLPAGASPDRTNKEFERRAIEQELRRRQFTIDVDVSGAVAGPITESHEVGLRITPPNGMVRTTPAKPLRGDGRASFSFTASEFWPLTGDLRIEVLEFDRDGQCKIEGARMVDINWTSPYNPVNGASGGATRYVTRAAFSR